MASHHQPSRREHGAGTRKMRVGARAYLGSVIARGKTSMIDNPLLRNTAVFGCQNWPVVRIRSDPIGLFTRLAHFAAAGSRLFCDLMSSSTLFVGFLSHFYASYICRTCLRVYCFFSKRLWMFVPQHKVRRDPCGSSR